MDIQIAATIFTVVGGVITIIASMYGMLKFMLKDIHKEIELLKDGQQKFDNEHREFKQEMRLTNRRLDGLYQVLLDKTYGTNIPSGLK